ncbi:hypothetical protein [Kitasatospora camelliae]|uniref:Uncharacterized protein n=1 Tax=Kitasatospora camelliae TaxID=3156397 RepID=A0AAU8K4B7_9ACTN
MKSTTDMPVIACTTLDDRRFAELAARTGLEPELAQRYASDPVAVLAEFGLSAAEPLYLDEILTDAELILIEDLDRPAAGLVPDSTISWTAPAPAAGA